MGKINSRSKGKRNELLLAHFFQKYGFDAKRGQQRTSRGTFASNQNKWCVKGNLLYCYLDDELLFFTDKKNWYLFKDKSVSKIANGYSAIRINGKEILVHRLLTNAEDNDIVDHINRNKQDNRLANLRKTDKSENAFNSKLRSTNKSGVSGVWFRKDTNKWVAEIKKNYKKISLGCFSTKEEAIRARKEAEVKYYGYQLTN